jgi:hypothetical protein
MEHPQRRLTDKLTDKDLCCAGLIRVQDGYERNREKIEREIDDRKSDVSEVWKGFNTMRNMVIAGMGSVVLAAAVFVGSIFAHVLKVGP